MTRLPARTRYALAALIAGAAVLVAACGWLGGDSPLTSNDTLLRYVPADTPYVIAAVEALPDEIMDLFADYTASIGDLVSATIRSALADMDNAGGFGGQDPFFSDPPVDPAVVELLTELAMPETLEASGIGRESRGVLYGFGLLPVMRLTLAEGHELERVMDLLVRLIEQDGELAVETATVAGQSYRYLAVAEARVIAAILDNELVLTVVPFGFGDAELQSILGLVLPEQSIADSGRLKAVADEYDFTPHLVSLLDIERFVARFLDAPGASDAALLELGGFRADAVPPVCRDEFRGAAAVAPRIVGGYTELDTSAMAASLVVELRDDIAAGLARIPTPVPGLGAETDAMIAFGLAADVARAREFALARLDAIAADPFECEAFAGLQAAIPELRLALTQPLPLPVDALKGLSLTLDIGDFDINSATGLPSDIEMSALVVTDDVEGTIAMLAAMDPAIAALDLQPDGQLVELTGPNAFFGPGANPFGSIVFGATATAIGIGLGEAGDFALERLLQARPGDPATVMSMSMDLARYYSLVADLLVGQAFAGDPQSVAVAASMSEMMRSIQAIYTRETIAVRFTGRGIEVPIRLELAGDN